MKWNELVNNFERICTLKTCLYYNIDQNYLTTNDLLDIKDIAENELEIIKLHPIDHNDLDFTLNLWRTQVYKKFKELQKQMYEGR